MKKENEKLVIVWKLVFEEKYRQKKQMEKLEEKKVVLKLKVLIVLFEKDRLFYDKMDFNNKYQ